MRKKLYPLQKQTRKKTFGIIAGIVLLLLVFGIVRSSTERTNQYQRAVDFLCSDQYSSAENELHTLPEDYKDTKTIVRYLAILQAFDRNDRSNCAAVLEELEQLDAFEQDSLNAHYDAFKAELSALDSQYKQDQAAADKLSQAFSALDIDQLTLEDQETIANLRSSYNNASPDIRDLVQGAEQLSRAEEQLTRLTLEEEYHIPELIDQIDAIGTVTLDSEPVISAALETYQTLPEKAQAYVVNYTVLTTAKQTLETLQAEKAEQEKAKREAAEREQQSQEAEQTVSGYGTVYWVSGGKVYHTSPNCPTLARSHSISSGSPPASRRPCKVCS